jgi:hypothetical protein
MEPRGRVCKRVIFFTRLGAAKLERRQNKFQERQGERNGVKRSDQGRGEAGKRGTLDSERASRSSIRKPLRDMIEI